jgi:hypothetical protein
MAASRRFERPRLLTPDSRGASPRTLPESSGVAWAAVAFEGTMIGSGSKPCDSIAVLRMAGIGAYRPMPPSTLILAEVAPQRPYRRDPSIGGVWAEPAGRRMSAWSSPRKTLRQVTAIGGSEIGSSRPRIKTYATMPMTSMMPAARNAPAKEPVAPTM